MASNFRFTGNPQVATYTPRGLDYFNYIPQLKAKMKGEAMAMAQAQSLDISGLAPQDIEKGRAYQQSLEKNKNSLIDSIMEGGTSPTSVVKQTIGLSRSTQDFQSKMTGWKENAVRVQKAMDREDSIAAQTGDYAYANARKKDMLERWGGSMTEEGEYNVFTGDSKGVSRVDLEKEFYDGLKLAAGNISAANYKPTDFEIVKIDLGDGKYTYKVSSKREGVSVDNYDAVDQWVEDYTNLLSTEGTKQNRYLTYLSEEDASNIMTGLGHSFTATGRAARRQENGAPTDNNSLYGGVVDTEEERLRKEKLKEEEEVKKKANLPGEERKANYRFGESEAYHSNSINFYTPEVTTPEIASASSLDVVLSGQGNAEKTAAEEYDKAVKQNKEFIYQATGKGEISFQDLYNLTDITNVDNFIVDTGDSKSYNAGYSNFLTDTMKYASEGNLKTDGTELYASIMSNIGRLMQLQGDSDPTTIINTTGEDSLKAVHAAQQEIEGKYVLGGIDASEIRDNDPQILASNIMGQLRELTEMRLSNTSGTLPTEQYTFDKKRVSSYDDATGNKVIQEISTKPEFIKVLQDDIVHRQVVSLADASINSMSTNVAKATKSREGLQAALNSKGVAIESIPDGANPLDYLPKSIADDLRGEDLESYKRLFENAIIVSSSETSEVYIMSNVSMDKRGDNKVNEYLGIDENKFYGDITVRDTKGKEKSVSKDMGLGKTIQGIKPGQVVEVDLKIPGKQHQAYGKIRVENNRGPGRYTVTYLNTVTGEPTSVEITEDPVRVVNTIKNKFRLSRQAYSAAYMENLMKQLEEAKAN